jgi:hypothetical protein
MHNGHLLVLFRIIAFSIEKVEEGSPSIFQALIVTGSPHTLMKENLLLKGIYNS